MKTYIPLGIEQGFALPRHGTCTASSFSMAGILLLLLHFSHGHCTFCCLCLCVCLLSNWKIQKQWKKICITLLTSGTRTFSSTASHFFWNLSTEQDHGLEAMPRRELSCKWLLWFWSCHLASLYLHFPSADGANWIQVMMKVLEKVSSSNVISQELSIPERNVFQCSLWCSPLENSH